MVNLISFVGVDKKTDLNKLVEIAKKFDIPTEWGFLISNNSVKCPNRYLSYQEILEKTAFLHSHEVKTSVHVCGKDAIESILKLEQSMLELVKNSRVQINLNVKNYSDLEDLADDILGLSYQTKAVIIQYNKSKVDLIQKICDQRIIIDYNEVHFLYDASGGLNKTISDIKPVIKNYYTGYAGGISPDNVTSILDQIEKVNKNNGYYIDMESGVRDSNDYLSLDKCESVISQTIDYINK